MCARLTDADDADRPWPRSVSPRADRPSTPAGITDTTRSDGSPLASLIEARAARLQHSNQIQKRRYLETQMTLARVN